MNWGIRSVVSIFFCFMPLCAVQFLMLLSTVTWWTAVGQNCSFHSEFPFEDCWLSAIKHHIYYCVKDKMTLMSETWQIWVIITSDYLEWMLRSLFWKQPKDDSEANGSEPSTLSSPVSGGGHHGEPASRETTDTEAAGLSHAANAKMWAWQMHAC